ncbi:MAG: Rpn family recombination-promoting nuclease/putative transposase [Methylococcaceae bacterium]
MTMKRKLITFDWAIKKLLRSKANFGILEGFLSELLKDDIVIIDILESESNQEHSDDKFNRVDMKVRNSRQELVIIEIQYDREHDYLQRIFYGVSKAALEHLEANKPYSRITRVISVNITYFDLGSGSDYIYHGTTRFVGMHDNDVLKLSDKQKKLFSNESVSDSYPEYYLIKVNKFDDIAKDTLDEWIYFLKHEEIKEGFTAKGLKLPESERKAYSRYEDRMHYHASMYQSSFVDGYSDGFDDGFDDGFSDGFSNGQTKGKEEGWIKGKEEGRVEGISAAIKLLALNLAREQVPIEVIAKVSGLSLSEIEQLLAGHG